MSPVVRASRFYHCETSIVLQINLKISPMSYRKVLWFAIQFQYLIKIFVSSNERIEVKLSDVEPDQFEHKSAESINL